MHGAEITLTRKKKPDERWSYVKRLGNWHVVRDENRKRCDCLSTSELLTRFVVTHRAE